jgi:predicted choloylglycine hydrolase
MEYEADYKFNEYLLTGRWPELSISLPEPTSAADWGCTCFSAMGNPNIRIMGRNFDWHDCIPLVLYTLPANGYASVSLVDLEYFGFHRGNLPDRSANQEQLLYTPYLPFDGMNEKGVAVGMMAISEARGPFDGEKVTIGEIEVIRLILDYAANTEEALQLLRNYNIQFTQPPIHYMISDRSGTSVIVEFIDGQMYTLTSSDSFHISTNFIIHGSQAPTHTSCWRYNQTFQSLMQTNGIIDHREGLSLLQQASQPNTIWSTIYDLQSGVFMVVPGRKYNSPLQFELAMQ